MAILTNKADVIANFVRYHGRQPNSDELKSGALIDYLTTKAPQEVEKLLSKNSPITGGLLWSDYQSKNNTTPAQTTSTNTSQTTTGKKATLYGPNNVKEVVDVGSARASELQSQGWGLTSGSYKVPTGTTTTTGTQSATNTNTTTEISNDDKTWINNLYQRYFDRNATSAELANWAKETPNALDQFLAKEQKVYGYVSKADGEDKKARYDAAMATIDNSNLPDDIKSLWKQVVGMYPDATDFNTEEIMNTFNQIKSETIDPYYKELADIAINDIKNTKEFMDAERERELEEQRTIAGQNIRQTKSGLEKSGMTFTGKAIEELGAESAYSQEEGDGTMPTQIPFAGVDGLFYEGNVNQSNRLLATSTAARYAQAQQELGRNAEDYLGSTEAANLGIAYSPSGVSLTGKLATEKEGKSASTLQQLINQWRDKQTLNTNI